MAALLAPRTEVRTGRRPPRRSRGAAVATALSALSAIFAASGPACADETSEFELAKSRFDGGQYDQAAARFAVLVDATKPPCAKSQGSGGCRLTDATLLERARALYAASLIAQKRPADADAQIAAILRANTKYEPNPALFPQEVLDRFTEVRGRMRPELEAIEAKKADDERIRRIQAQKAKEARERYDAEILSLASEERVVERRSRWLALVPFGAGQFQNGDTGLGWFFAATEIAAGGASIVAAGIASHYASVDPTKPDPTTGKPIDRKALESSLDTAVLVNRVAFGVWAATTIAGIVQGEIALVPERTTTRRRPIPPPPKPSAVPTITAGGGGVMIGVVGRF